MKGANTEGDEEERIRNISALPFSSWFKSDFHVLFRIIDSPKGCYENLFLRDNVSMEILILNLTKNIATESLIISYVILAGASSSLQHKYRRDVVL